MATTLFLAFGLMLLIVVGMALGVMFGRQPIKGSCGGMGALGINAECEICGGNPAACDATPGGPNEASRSQDLPYDASQQRNPADRSDGTAP